MGLKEMLFGEDEEPQEKEDEETQPTCSSLKENRKEQAKNMNLPSIITDLGRHNPDKFETEEDENGETKMHGFVKGVEITFSRGMASTVKSVKYDGDTVFGASGVGDGASVHRYKPGEWLKNIKRAYKKAWKEKHRRKQESLRDDWGIDPCDCELEEFENLVEDWKLGEWYDL